MNDKLIETFLEEAHDLLDGLEEHLLDLEKDPSDVEAMNAAFRVLHSIKGSASMFGYKPAGDFAHEVEAALDHFRSASLPASLALTDAVLRSRDFLRVLLDVPEAAPADERESLVAELAALAGKAPAKAAGAGAGDPVAGTSGSVASPEAGAPAGETARSGSARDTAEAVTYRIRFTPSRDSYRRGVRPESLVRELRALGEASVRCDCSSVPRLSELDPEDCYVSWDVLLTTAASADAVRDVFIFEEGSSRLSLEIIDSDDVMDGAEVRKLGEILAARELSGASIADALSRQRPIGEILVKDLGASPAVVADALFEQQHARNVAQAAREETERKTIRIRSDKLDGLLNLAGELVTVQAQLSQAVSQSGERSLQGISDNVKRLAAELRATAMQLRLVPIDSIFSKYKRLVRDLSKSLGKDINLELEGGDTEIDKSVIDVLSDPLMHLVRNAADHGLEPADERERAGKGRAGTITLGARHAGAFVRVSVKDDGGGLRRDRILAKAVERHIVQPDASLADDEIDQLIFEPGFSTAASVSSISGRGVGLDVVKTAIDQLGGSLGVKSTLGAGTEFTLDIPLTLAIIDGFLVRSGERMFVIPLLSVDSCFERERPADSERLITRGREFIPYLSARELFGGDGEPPAREEVVIVSVFDSKLAMGFDQLLGGYQTVVKPIGEITRFSTGVSGAAILADGGIALILDVVALARSYREAAAAN